MINVPRVHLPSKPQAALPRAGGKLREACLTRVDNIGESQTLGINWLFPSARALDFLESERLWRCECSLEVMEITVGRREIGNPFAGRPMLSFEAGGWVPAAVACTVLRDWRGFSPGGRDTDPTFGVA